MDLPLVGFAKIVRGRGSVPPGIAEVCLVSTAARFLDGCRDAIAIASLAKEAHKLLRSGASRAAVEALCLDVHQLSPGRQLELAAALCEAYATMRGAS